MRVYGPNLYERALTSFLAGAGLLLLGFTVAAAIVPATLAVRSAAAGGLLVGATGAAALALIFAGGGSRQNRAALDLGQGLLLAVSATWIVWAAADGRVLPLVVGVVMALVAAVVALLRRRAIRTRFKPRFFSPRQFETMVQVADTMIEGDGREAVHPITTAINVDHLLAATDSPSTAQIRMLLVIVEWLLPLLVWRPIPFSSLGSTVRRQAIRRVIDSHGPLRAVARTLKVLSCFGYYGTPAGMEAMGFVPFEQRPRAARLDMTPLVHPDPFKEPRSEERVRASEEAQV
jgi:hypothetical protein